MKSTFKKTLIVIGILVILAGGLFLAMSASGVPKSETDATNKEIIRGRVAVFLTPSKDEIEDLRKKSENNESFYTSADDRLYYLSGAYDFFEDRKIPILTTDKKHFEFIKDNGEMVTTDRALYIETDPWGGIILFDGYQDPLQVEDVTDMESYYQSYFMNAKNI